MDLLIDLKAEYENGLITRGGYVLRGCQILQVENPLKIDRRWLSDQLGMTYAATTQQLHTLKSKGLI